MREGIARVACRSQLSGLSPVSSQTTLGPVTDDLLRPTTDEGLSVTFKLGTICTP